MNPTVLPNGNRWLRLTQPHYADPFDMSYAQKCGGRWNPPDSWPTLYLNEDMATVHAQVRHMFVGRGIDPDDIDDGAPIELAAATLPDRQRVADILTDEGAVAAGLPSSYPSDSSGATIEHDATQSVAMKVNAAGLRGVWCRSATGVGNEVAWFPGPRSSAVPAWEHPLPFGSWRHAASLVDVVS